MHKHIFVVVLGLVGLTAQNASADSAGARSKRNFGLGVQGGALISSVAGAGEVVFNAGSYVQFALTFGRGTDDLTEDVKEASEEIALGRSIPKTPPYILAAYLGPFESVKQESEVVALRSRIFIPNSFFVSLGVAQRSEKVTMEENAAFRSVGLDSVKMELEVDTVMSYVGIGNQWMWDNGFYIGADWIGGFRPLSHTRKVGATVIGAEPRDEEEALYREVVHNGLLFFGDEAGKELGKTIDLSLLAFMIGFSF